MRILVVASSNREVTDFVGKLEFVHQIEPQYKSYKFGDMDLDILISGYGSVFTAYQLTRALNMIKGESIIGLDTQIVLSISFPVFLFLVELLIYRKR